MLLQRERWRVISLELASSGILLLTSRRGCLAADSNFQEANKTMSNTPKALVFSVALLFFSSLAVGQHYTQTNLVANFPATPPAAVMDPNLQNPWGLVAGPGSPWWVG